uniref:Putative sodium-coupled neutral amino acid transporter 11 n=1 Tax=Clastoptera arizonana TaxID=38151 RepID=A0A1B6DRT8_9HEMI
MGEPNKSSGVNEKSYILEAHKMALAQQVEEIDFQNDCCYNDTEEIINTKKDKTTSLKFASFNYINSIVGSGVIGIPYALLQAGFGMGFLLLVFVAWITDYSLLLMVRSAHISGSYSYQGLMEAAFGRGGFYLLTLLQFIYPFIAMVSYNIVVGDTITKVLIRMFSLSQSDLLARRNFVVLVATIFITVPLCLFKDMVKLARASLLSLFFVVFILAAITFRLFTIENIPVTNDAYQFFNIDIVPSIGIMAFAFMCHHNVFLLYHSIDNINQRTWDNITHISVFIAFLITLCFGVTGYVTFTGNVQGDLLENYCWDDDLMNFSRLAFGATILLTYPIECLVTRSVLSQILQLDSSTSHYVTTIGIVGVTYIISVSTDCLGIVLELNGVFAAVPLAFILPAVSYLKLEEGSVFTKQKLPALGLALFGIVVGCVGTTQLFAHFRKIDSCSHGSIMRYCVIHIPDLNTSLNIR